ncbi:MAG: SDR family oxidoreductase [Bacteroidales bacterium]|jgi:nucleoside-diphosphate-sugar epimerase|nr:SDR family oxidoreductase [Bacteroidales bacterium]
MKIFLTGGTGFIGSRLTERLLAEGHEPVLLLRNPARVSPGATGITYVKGDIFSTSALDEGMKGCEWVFHLAAFTKPWSKDPSEAYRTNVTGTINVLEAALANGVKRVVMTSTGGTIGCSNGNCVTCETTNPSPEFNTLYEKTKAEAEKLAVEYSEKGLPVVVVNPTRVFGPGRLSKSNSMTKIISLYRKGLWRIMPGDGNSVGNYVYIDDVVNGHILAAVKGRPGDRYILGGENLSFRELFSSIGAVTGKKRLILPLPFPVMRSVVAVNTFLTGLTGMPPLITRDWLDKYMNNWIMSSDKAVTELGYTVTPFKEGVADTIKWLNTLKDGKR